MNKPLTLRAENLRLRLRLTQALRDLWFERKMYKSLRDGTKPPNLSDYPDTKLITMLTKAYRKEKAVTGGTR